MEFKKNIQKMVFLTLFISFIFSQCDPSEVEDDCGDCWVPYCYCISDHIPNFDVTQDFCENGQQCWWIGPGGAYEPGDYEFCLFDPYWNSGCMGCMDFEADNYDLNATISCNENCDDEYNDCCTYTNLNIEFNDTKLISIESIYPNPSNQNTNVIIASSTNENTIINIYNIKGQIIKNIFSGHLNQGNHIFDLNTSSLSSGIYIIRINTSSHSDTHTLHIFK